MTRRDPFGFSGALIDSQIRVGEPIGEGGFSVVYRGRHLGLDESVAIKCLKLPTGLTPRMVDAIVERFRAESRISYRLSQGNLDIVRSVSSGTAHSPITGALIPYIALEWLEGPSLSKELEVRRKAGLAGRTLGEVMTFLEPAARALDYAHKQGVVHRDVKPGNLLLVEVRDGTRRIKVLDFGLAKIIDTEGTGLVPTAHTVAQMTICSPSYGAPEQFSSALGPISAATDVYSFAMIVLEMLRDEKVRPADSIAVAAEKALDPTPRGPAALGIPVSPEVDAVFLRALALKPGERPKDLGEFWNELRRLSTAAVPQGYVPSVLSEPEVVLPPTMTIAAVSLPILRTTQPMKRSDPAGVPGTLAGLGKERSHGFDPKSTSIMPERPLTQPPVPPQRSLPARTATLPAAGAASVPSAAPVPAARIAAARGVGAGSVPAPPKSSSPGRIIVLVVLLLLLTSSVIVMAGYVAHRWMAERGGVPTGR
jgi:serine/threonine protein kinase